MTACEYNRDDQIIDALIELKPKLGPNSYEKTALHFSVAHNNLTTTEKLLNAGAPVNTIHKRGTETLFYISFTKASDEISKSLLDHLRDINQPLSHSGARAIHLAAITGKDTLIPYLIDELEASKFIKNNDGAKPVHYAAFRNHEQTLRILIDHGCFWDEGRGKIEAEFWPRKEINTVNMFGNVVQVSKIDHTRRNYVDGFNLYLNGGTPSRFYEGDESQIMLHEEACRIKDSKDKQKAKKNDKEIMKKKKAEINKRKKLEQEKQKLDKQKDKLLAQELKLMGNRKKMK